MEDSYLNKGSIKIIKIKPNPDSIAMLICAHADLANQDGLMISGKRFGLLAKDIYDYFKMFYKDVIL
jgi:hypothetical protein